MASVYGKPVIMSLLLYVVLSLLGVTTLILLVAALRQHPSVDVEGWHRRLRILRETAQPDSEQAADEQHVTDTSDRNVRLISPEKESAQRPEESTPRAEGERAEGEWAEEGQKDIPGA